MVSTVNLRPYSAEGGRRRLSSQQRALTQQAAPISHTALYTTETGLEVSAGAVGMSVRGPAPSDGGRDTAGIARRDCSRRHQETRIRPSFLESHFAC